MDSGSPFLAFFSGSNAGYEYRNQLVTFLNQWIKLRGWFYQFGSNDHQ